MTELEQNNREEIIDFYNKECGRLCLKVKTLQDENEELKERLRVESQSLHEQCEIVSKQVEQIKKMKCCKNCKHCDCDNYCRALFSFIRHIEGKCDYWELR